MYCLNVSKGKVAEPKSIPERAGELLWVDLEKPSKEDLSTVTQRFGLHPLAIEDATTEKQHPKVDDYESYLFILLKTIDFQKRGIFKIRRVSFFLAKDFLVTIHEEPCPEIEEVKKEIAAKKKPAITQETDFLAYRIMDRLVDGCFPALTDMEEELEKLEVSAVKSPSEKMVSRIMEIRKAILKIRKVIWPTRELFLQLRRGGFPQMRKKNLVYYKDVYDHVSYLFDMVEGNRDVVSSVLDVYLSSVSNNMNKVMKVLTVIATIFIPLTFLTGVYGMNFQTAVSPFNMPELAWEFGYLFFWLVCAVVAALMLVMFKKRGWL